MVSSDRPPSDNDSVRSGYQQRIEELDARIVKLCRRDRWLSRSRGVVFLLALLLAVWGWTVVEFRLPGLTAAGMVFVGFVAIAGLHEQVHSERRTVQLRRELQRQQWARYERKWAEVPVPEIEIPEEHVAVATDLDLFGRGSVYHWLCRCHTPEGRRALRDWLLSPASAEEVARRQPAVAWLARQADRRDDLELHGRMLAASDTGPAAFVGWAEGPPWWARRRGLRWLLRVLTLVMVVLPGLIACQLVDVEWTLAVLGLVAVHIILNALFVGGVHDLFNQITAGRDELVHYVGLFEAVDALPDDCPRLRQLKARLHVGSPGFRVSLRQLKRIMRLAGGRRSSRFGVPYVVVQILWFWDFHILQWLERWQNRHGHAVRGWFESVAELEALSCLASAAADHPGWVYAQVDATASEIDTQALGHPLLPPAKCRRNDVHLGPPGTFLLVTGSNMSGKSTLLRSLGVNVVLAQAGGVVCAARLRLPPVELATSIRVSDSLNEGVSFFYAELQRLKHIVDRARRPDDTSQRYLFFLLDEILQGTNSAERQIAVVRVIGHLVSRPTLGAVSTHDLELAAAPELNGRCQTVHFREQFHGAGPHREMSFDYRLRDGVCPTTNALQLLEMVGLAE